MQITGKQIEVMLSFILDKPEQNEPNSLCRWFQKVHS